MFELLLVGVLSAAAGIFGAAFVLRKRYVARRARARLRDIKPNEFVVVYKDTIAHNPRPVCIETSGARARRFYEGCTPKGEQVFEFYQGQTLRGRKTA